MQALKGKTIDFAEFVVGSKNTTDNNINVFLATTLTGTPIAEGTLEVNRALTKVKWTLDKPYTITGEEECLYIGYTAEIGTTYNLLISDKSYDIEGCNFAYNNGAWVDTYDMNRGSALIFVNAENADDYTDVIVGRSKFDGYYKAGEECKLTPCFINAGTTAINSFDAIIDVDGKTTTKHFADLNIEENAEKWIRTSPESFCNTSDAKVLSEVLNDYDQETADFYRWHVTLTQQKLKSLLDEKLKMNLGDIIDLKAVERGKSGRISKLLIVGTERSFTIGKELEIRRALSDSHLYSSAFVVDRKDIGSDGVPQRFELTGAGWGHGVGLCQIGAAVMGEKGFDYRQILLHYYRNAEIKDIY